MHCLPVLQRKLGQDCLKTAQCSWSSIPAGWEVSRGGGALPSGQPVTREQWERGCDKLFLSAARGAPRMAGASRRATTYPAIPRNTGTLPSCPAPQSNTPQNPFTIYLPFLFKSKQIIRSENSEAVLRAHPCPPTPGGATHPIPVCDSTGQG